MNNSNNNNKNELFFTCSDLAGLPGMPGTVTGCRGRLANSEFRMREGRRGGGREYPLRVLPAETRDAIAKSMATQAGICVGNDVPPLPVIQQASAAALRDWQRGRGEARAAIVAEVKRLGADLGMDRAVRSVVQLARDGKLPAQLQRLVPLANARAGESSGRSLSRATVYHWMAEAKKGFAFLAPKPSRREADAPEWLPKLLAIYQRPTKPSLPYCLELLAKQLTEGVEIPSETSARRWLAKMSVVDLARGRMGARELKSIKSYVKRDSSGMLPGACYTADGHTFDAEIAHPKHGQPFRPEITSVMDVATRRAVGWSAGLNESTWAVLDAQRNAIENAGICSLWYVDNGSGYRNAIQEDQVAGFAARIGMTVTHSLPYNSQARGVIERSHQSIWVRAAKELPTYMGAAMDREARQKVFKITRQDIKAAGSSRLLMPWRDFLVFCQEQVDAYNDRPHRALAKTRDEATGKKRHMSPNEVWEKARSEGWEPVLVSKEDAADLFRPHKLCNVNRGMVQLFTNSYFHKSLDAYHGERVRVGYDIHDAGRVWVRDASGRLICVAEFEGNKRDYFPLSVIVQADQRRAQGKIQRASLRIAEAEAELNPPAMLEHLEPDVLEASMPPVLESAGAALPDNVVALKTHAARPMFDTNADKYRWLLENEGQANEEDEGWLAWYRDTEEWFDLFGVGARREVSEEF